MVPDDLGSAGPYRLEALLGKGGMGRVYRGTHLGTGHRAAVKIDRSRPSAASRLSFAHEVRLMAALDHPNCVGVLDAGTGTHGVAGLDPDADWVAMELTDRGTLADRKPTSAAELFHVLRGVLRGLAHAHARGLVHRDIKMSNVLWGPPRGTDPLERAVVSDFGIGHVVHDPDWNEHDPIGTPQYMAPEQVRADWRSQGPWTDLYQVGILAWRLATGWFPFSGSLERLLHAHAHRELPVFAPRFPVPAPFEAWCRGLLVKDWRARPWSAASTADALARIEPSRGGPPPRSVSEADAPTRSPVTGATPRGRPIGRGIDTLKRGALIGREQEQAVLARALEAVVRDGRARWIQVVGAPGVGRTRLGEWVGEHAIETGQARWWAADGPWPTTLGRVLRVCGLDPEEAATRLEPALGSHPLATAAARWILERSPSPDPTTTLGDVLAACLRRDPLVITVESEEAARRLGRVLDARAPVLVVDLTATPPTDLATTRIELGPLPPEAIRRVLAQWVELDGEIAERIEGMVAGNPGYARALVEHVREGGAQGALGVDAPVDLTRGWSERVRRALAPLDGAVREALEVGALLDPLERGPWSAVCGAEIVARAAGEALRAGVLRSVDTGLREFQFVHGLARAAVLEQAGARGPSQAARVLDALGADAPPHTRARWARRAGRLEEAFEALYEDLVLRGTLGDLRGRGRVEAFEALAGRLRGDPASDPRRRAMVEHVTLLWSADDALSDATFHHADALGAAAGDPALHGEILLALGHARFRGGDWGAAMELLRRARRRFNRVRAHARVRTCDASIGDMLLSLGQVDEAHGVFERMARPLPSEPPGFDLSDHHYGLARTWRVRGELHRAQTHAAAARRLAAAHGDTSRRLALRNLEAQLAEARGDLLEALAIYEACLEETRLLGSWRSHVFRLNAAMVLARLERWDGVREHVVGWEAHAARLQCGQRAVQLLLAAHEGTPVEDLLADLERLTEAGIALDDVSELCRRAMWMLPEHLDRLEALVRVHRSG